MDVEPIAFVPIPRSPAPTGVSADLAAARKQLREAAPAGSWDGVQAEVQRLQNVDHLPPLDALRAVYAKLASGWLPASSR